MQFKYTIINNDTPVELLCVCDYDYSTDRGPEAFLTSAKIGRTGWNIAKLLTEEDREECEAFYLQNLYEIEQANTHLSLTRDNEL
jgi:hypothetical protein